MGLQLFVGVVDNYEHVFVVIRIPSVVLQTFELS